MSTPEMDKPRYQLTVTCRIWDSRNGDGIGFDESTSIESRDFGKLMEMLKAFHELAQKFVGAA